MRGSSQDEARAFIRRLLARKARLPADFDDNTDFIAAGIVDSIGIIKFVLELESHFGIEIDPVDMESVKFRSISGLAGIIDGKVAA